MADLGVFGFFVFFFFVVVQEAEDSIAHIIQVLYHQAIFPASSPNPES